MVKIKRILIQTDEGHFNYRKENEWLKESNIMIKVREFQETINLFDVFIYDYHLYMVTELSICDL